MSVKVYSGAPDVDYGIVNIYSGTPDVDYGIANIYSGAPDVDYGIANIYSGAPDVDYGIANIYSAFQHILNTSQTFQPSINNAKYFQNHPICYALPVLAGQLQTC